jgi:hypothetical protein
LYHSVSKIFSLLAILFLIRVLLFLRFKTYWRNNKFFDLGFGIFFGAILARIKDFSGSTDWLGIGGFVFNLIDIFYLFGLLFLIIGVIICPKKNMAMGKRTHILTIQRKRRRKEKLRKLRKKYKLAKTEQEKKKILEKVKKIAPWLSEEEFLPSSESSNSFAEK